MISVQTSSCKVPVILVIFQWNMSFLDRGSENSHIKSFMTTHPLGAELFCTDEQTDMTKLTDNNTGKCTLTLYKNNSRIQVFLKKRSSLKLVRSPSLRANWRFVTVSKTAWKCVLNVGKCSTQYRTTFLWHALILYLYVHLGLQCGQKLTGIPNKMLYVFYSFFVRAKWQVDTLITCNFQSYIFRSNTTYRSS
jgi:hypothetical protein